MRGNAGVALALDWKSLRRNGKGTAVRLSPFLFYGGIVSQGMVATTKNPESSRHLRKYVVPKLGKENGLAMRLDFAGLQAGQLVTGLEWGEIDSNVCVKITAPELSGPIFVPLSKISKYTNPSDKHTNSGLKYEEEVVKNLNEVGIMEGASAGCTGGYDCTFLRGDGVIGYGELKESDHCVMGQGVLHHFDDAWRVSDGFVARSPRLADIVSLATIGGRNLLSVVSETVRKPMSNEIMRGVALYSDEMDFTPALAYLSDKRVDVLHFANKGTFGLTDFVQSLDKPEGSCKVRIRGKHLNSLTAQVVIANLKKSHTFWDFFSLSSLLEIKERYLGHGRKSEKVPPET